MTKSLLNARNAAQLPRVRRVPRYSTSAGLEAADLAAAAGLRLDPWQVDTLVDAMGERPDGRWSAFRVAIWVSRQNGKGALLEARELFGLFLGGEELILHTAHELKTSLEAFRRILGLIENTPDLSRRVRRVVHTNGSEAIELTNGARLRFVARSKGSGRGFSADTLIFDEAYAATNEQIEALVPTMSARPNPQIWFTSSPPLDSASGEPMYALKDAAETGDDSLAYFDWGQPIGCALDDRSLWAAANPALGIRVSEEFVARERAAMSNAGFARERLGVWPPRAADGWAVISEADWRAVIDRASEVANPVAIAVDVTPDRSMTSVAIAGRRADGLGHVEIIDHRRGTGWVVDRLVELNKRWDPCAIVIDVTGPAGSLLGDVEAAGLEIVKPFARQAAAACGAFWDAICGTDDESGEPRRALRHRDQPMLSVALAGAVKRELADTWAWSRRDTTVDISPLVAATLAHWGHASYWNSGPMVLDGDLCA